MSGLSFLSEPRMGTGVAGDLDESVGGLTGRRGSL